MALSYSDELIVEHTRCAGDTYYLGLRLTTQAKSVEFGVRLATVGEVSVLEGSDALVHWLMDHGCLWALVLLKNIVNGMANGSCIRTPKVLERTNRSGPKFNE